MSIYKVSENQVKKYKSHLVNVFASNNSIILDWTNYISPNGTQYDLNAVSSVSTSDYTGESTSNIWMYSSIYRSSGNLLYYSILVYNKNTNILVNTADLISFSWSPSSVYYNNWHIYVNHARDGTSTYTDFDIENGIVTTYSWSNTTWVVADNNWIILNWYKYKSHTAINTNLVKHFMEVIKQ